MSVKKKGDFDVGIFVDMGRSSKEFETNIDFQDLCNRRRDSTAMGREILPMFDRLYK